MRKKTAMIAVALLVAVMMTGCAKAKDYSGEYRYETDDQYSYITNIDSWKKYQSDGSGQYILMNNYIYYYNNETGQMNPLCAKANCLHDMETDKTRRTDCNAYVDKGISNDEMLNDPGYKFIQYYEGNIYYTIGSCLYRVNGDGTVKKKIFTTEGDNQAIVSWLIHRGKLYYEVHEYTYDDGNVYAQGRLREINLGDRMNETNARVIFETDKALNMHDFGRLSAYRNYLFFSTDCFSQDFHMTDYESWVNAQNHNYYMYDTETDQLAVLEVPDPQSDTDGIGSITFLKDKMLIKKYDDMQDEEYPTTIYSMDYDTKEMTPWMEGVAQDSQIAAYDDYVIINNADIQFFKYDNPDSCHIWIYTADAKELSDFEYPVNSIGTFSGFGPDGVSVDVTQDDTFWYVNELRFEDVQSCNGETIIPDIVNKRKFGTLNKEWY